MENTATTSKKSKVGQFMLLAGAVAIGFYAGSLLVQASNKYLFKL